MATLAWKEDKAYAVHFEKKDGKPKRRWILLGTFKRIVDAKAAFERHLSFEEKDSQKKGMFSDIAIRYKEFSKTTKALLTYEGELKHLAVLENEFGTLRVDQITADKLESFRKANNWKPATWRNRLGLLKQILDYAEAHGFRTEKPFATVKIPRPQLWQFDPRVCDHEILEAFLEALEPKYKPAAMVMRYTGLRPVELNRLEPNNVDFKKQLLTIRSVQTKTKRPRSIPLHPKVIPYLKLLPIRFNHFSLMHAFQRACKKINALGQVTPYVLRHQFATDLLNAGADIRTVQALMGHTDIRMTARYTNPNEAVKNKAIQLLK